MRCLRFDLRRKFLPYLEGSGPAAERVRLEKHLKRCANCRATLIRLGDGHRLAQSLRNPDPEGTGPAPEFQGLMSGARAGSDSNLHRWTRFPVIWSGAASRPWVVYALTAVVLAQLALLAMTNRRILFPKRYSSIVRPTYLDLSGFRSLSLSDVRGNTLPRIATEGYVRDVHIDEEERTVHFKLVESPQGSENFVVCEMISPLGLPVPQEGSRVKVYGIARFDAQANRNWHEVNPVLNIATLNR